MLKGGNPEQVIRWLVANAKNMREEMFFDDGNVWDCEDYQLLMLRAYAPEGVFTEEAMEGFLSQVEGNEDLTEIADALFGDDEDLISLLPDRLSMLEDQLVNSMKDAYRRGIRDADPDIEDK